MGGASSILLPPSSPFGLKALKIKSILGQGGFATVYCVKKYYSPEIALKRTELPADNLDLAVEMAIGELEALTQVSDHSFITKVLGAFHLRSACYLLLEYHTGGDLRFHLKSCLFTEQQVAYFISCLGSALNHLHQRGILHRDIKPENILLSSHGIPKLTDFGSAYIEEFYSVPICDSSTGTLCYMAPETLTISKYHSYQSDYWSLGVTAFELLFHFRPFPKHCPLSLIHFVGNQFQSLWNRILAEQDMGQSKKKKKREMSRAPFMDQFYDFHKSNESITSEQRQAECLYPSTFFISTNDLVFVRSIPLDTFAGLPISDECHNFLKTILDARIPHRFGQLSQFHLFSNHPWFRIYNYHNQDNTHDDSITGVALPPLISSLSLVQSPFRPIPSIVQRSLQLKYQHEIIPANLMSFPVDREARIPDDLIKRLQRYQFPSPSSDSISISNQDES
jgi:serine/threonine protein kinase